jgi:hypothetical protein
MPKHIAKHRKKLVRQSAKMPPAFDVQPDYWGRNHGWPMFHLAALSAPADLGSRPDEQKRLYDYYTNYGKGLPCTSCRGHYAEGIATNPPDISSRQALIAWTHHVHNKVNEALGKPVLSYADAWSAWQQAYGIDFLTGERRPVAAATVTLSVDGALLLAAGLVAVGYWAQSRR